MPEYPPLTPAAFDAMMGDRKVVLLHDPDADPDDGGRMRFRLIYRGELLSSGNDAIGGKADHKHAIRLQLHPQMKRLWDVVPFLKARGSTWRPGELTWATEDYSKPPTLDPTEIAAAEPSYGPWGFVPLVRAELDLLCGLDILFLRSGPPGRVTTETGDIDGRLKTLLDALAAPDSQQRYHERQVGKGQTPLYVLLSSDRLITKVAVETDELLDIGHETPATEAHVIITVTLRPYVVSTRNMQFA